MNMEEKAKERVVGAAVLMAAAVIFIPMILSGPVDDRPPDVPGAPPSSRDEPRAAAAEFSSRIVPLGEPGDARGPAPEKSPPAAAPSAPPKPEAPAPAKAPAPVTRAAPGPQPSPAPPAPKAAPEPRPSPVPPAAKAVAGSGWVVQLGSFANPRNAHALRDRLKGKGYAAYAVSSGKGKDAVTRVYVGPEAEREKAEGLVERLLSETRLKGIVVHDPGR